MPTIPIIFGRYYLIQVNVKFEHQAEIRMRILALDLTKYSLLIRF
jgi:hypothetical protein